GLALGGCDSDNSQLTTGDSVEESDTSSEKPGEQAPDTMEEPVDSGDVEADSSEPEPPTPGFMYGYWRVAPTEAKGDEVVVYFDLRHYEGDPTIQGDYLMGMAMYNGHLNGNTHKNSLVESSYDGNTLIIKW